MNRTSGWIFLPSRIRAATSISRSLPLVQVPKKAFEWELLSPLLVLHYPPDEEEPLEEKEKNSLYL